MILFDIIKGTSLNKEILVLTKLKAYEIEKIKDKLLKDKLNMLNDKKININFPILLIITVILALGTVFFTNMYEVNATGDPIASYNMSSGEMIVSNLAGGTLKAAVSRELTQKGKTKNDIKILKLQGNLIDSSDFEYIRSGENGQFSNLNMIDMSGLANMTEIPAYALYDTTNNGLFSNLKTVLFSNASKKIGEMAFRDCIRLINIDIANINEIGKASFFGCSNLTFKSGTNLNPQLKDIPDRAFYFCSDLKGIDLSHVSKIGNEAFEGCSNINNINLGNVTELGTNAFLICLRLDNVIKWPKPNIQTGENVFSHCAFDLSNGIPFGHKGLYRNQIPRAYLKAKGKTKFSDIYAGTKFSLSSVPGADLYMKNGMTYMNFAKNKSLYSDWLDTRNVYYNVPTHLNKIVFGPTIKRNGKNFSKSTIDTSTPAYYEFIYRASNEPNPGSWHYGYWDAQNVTYTLKVIRNTISINSAQKNIYLTRGKKHKLTPVAKTKNKKSPGFTYESSKPSIVKVSKRGKLTASKKRTGRAVISVKSKDGKIYKYKVRVVKKKKTLKKIVVKNIPTKRKMKKGKTKTLKVVLKPKKATNVKVKFKSGNPKIVSVDKAGLLKAKKKGKAKITVVVGKKKKSFIIRVR